MFDFIYFIVAELGPWLWMIAGFLLLTGEALSPRLSLLGYGLSAMAVAAFMLMSSPGSVFWAWWVQVIFFLVFSSAFVFLANRIFR